MNLTDLVCPRCGQVSTRMMWRLGEPAPVMVCERGHEWPRPGGIWWPDDLQAEVLRAVVEALLRLEAGR